MAPHTTEGKDYPSLHSLVDIPKLLVICLVSVVSFLPFCHMGFAMTDDHPLSRDMLCTSLHHASNYAFVRWNASLFSENFMTCYAQSTCCHPFRAFCCHGWSFTSLQDPCISSQDSVSLLPHAIHSSMSSKLFRERD